MSKIEPRTHFHLGLNTAIYHLFAHRVNGKRSGTPFPHLRTRSRRTRKSIDYFLVLQLASRIPEYFRVDCHAELLDNRGMSDLKKILISAVIGMATGLVGGTVLGVILEPLKFAVGTFFAKNRAIRAIYEEVADIYYSVVILGEEMGDPYLRSAIEDMRTESFDYYYEHNREAVFAIEGWQELRNFADYIKLCRREYADETASLDEIFDGMKTEFDIRMQHGLMNKKLLDKYVERRRWKKDRIVPT